MSNPQSVVRRRARRAGFSLIELMVVMAILALIASFVGPQVLGFLGRAKAQAAESQIAGIESALDLFMLDVGRYPSEREGLEALIEDPGRVLGWSGPYLKDGKMPLDPWGNDYVYEPGRDGRTVTVLSLGADGAPGGDGAAADLGA